MSLRARMTWLIVLVMGIVVALYGMAVYIQFKRVVHNDLDSHLHRDYEQATQSLEYRNGKWTWEEHQHYHEEEEAIAQRIEIWSLEGKRQYVKHVTSDLEALDLQQPAESDPPYQSVTFGSGQARVLTGKFTSESSLSPGVWYLRVIRTDAPVQSELRTLLMQLFSMYPVALLLAAATGWWLAGRLLQPIAKLGNAAHVIHAGALDQRLPVERDDEIGRLASAFNQAFSRLETAFDQLSRFSSDVAHELRTPLTALRTQGELALRNREVNLDAGTRKLLVAMLDESSRLGRMIDRLLLLARADQGRIAPTLTSCRLAPIVQGAINLMQVLAEERQLRLTLEGDATVSAKVDPDFLQQVLIDLLDNALRHAVAQITVTIKSEDGLGCIDIDDDGPGIAPENRERMVQRFARGDEARTRTGLNANGFGLGLAIASSLTALQNGTLQLAQAPGREGGSQGLSVRLKFGIDTRYGNETTHRSNGVVTA